MLLQRRVGLDGDMRESMKAEFRTGFNQLNHQLSETTMRLTGEFQALLHAEVQQLQSVCSQIAALEFARVGEAVKRSHLEGKVAAQEILASQEALASQLKKLAGKTGSHNVLQEVIELQGYKATADGHSNANSWELQRTLQSLHASIDKLMLAILQKPEEGMAMEMEMNAGFLKIGQAIKQSKKEVDVPSIHTAIQDHGTDMNGLFKQLCNTISMQDAVMLETMQNHRESISNTIDLVIKESMAGLPRPGMHEKDSPVLAEMRDSLFQLREGSDQRNKEVDLAMQDSSQEVHSEIRDSVARCIQQNREDGDMTRMHMLNLCKSLESSVAEQLSKFHGAGRTDTDVPGRIDADQVVSRRDADTLDLSSELTAMVEAISELRAEVDLTAVLSAVKDSRSDEVVLPAIAELRSDVVRAIEVGQAEVYVSVCGQIGKLKDEIMMQLTFFQNSAHQSKVDRRPSDGSLQSFTMEAESSAISDRQASQLKVPAKAQGRSGSAGGSDSGESGSRSGSEIFDMSMHRESSFPTAPLPGEQIDLQAFDDPAAKKKTKRQVDLRVSR